MKVFLQTAVTQLEHLISNERSTPVIPATTTPMAPQVAPTAELGLGQLFSSAPSSAPETPTMNLMTATTTEEPTMSQSEPADAEQKDDETETPDAEQSSDVDSEEAVVTSE